MSVDRLLKIPRAPLVGRSFVGGRFGASSLVPPAELSLAMCNDLRVRNQFETLGGIGGAGGVLINIS